MSRIRPLAIVVSVMLVVSSLGAAASRNRSAGGEEFRGCWRSYDLKCYCSAFRTCENGTFSCPSSGDLNTLCDSAET
jgi:hypothetical protein